jgi:hypothetical protein
LLFGKPVLRNGRELYRKCFITPEGLRLVETDFTPKDQSSAPVQITESLKAFHVDHPHYERNCFLMMRFGTTTLHRRLVGSISNAARAFDLDVLRADDKEYHDELYTNILTYDYGCSFGIAVFERIEKDDFNPTVALEVGLMFGMRKKVCFLTDQNLKTLHSDIVGKLYKTFDPTEPEATIRDHLVKWLRDNHIIAR